MVEEQDHERASVIGINDPGASLHPKLGGEPAAGRDPSIVAGRDGEGETGLDEGFAAGGDGLGGRGVEVESGGGRGALDGEFGGVREELDLELDLGDLGLVLGPGRDERGKVSLRSLPW
jgi:hypothetical protein